MHNSKFIIITHHFPAVHVSLPQGRAGVGLKIYDNE
jgi:hypothetical protein